MKLNILFLTLDDFMVLEFIGYSLEDSLEDTTIGIFEASREKSAIEILESHKIHLIIADMNISTLESYEFFDKIQLEKEYKDIPFVFLSSNEDDYDIAILKGISNFFLKPLDIDLLLKTLHKILKRNHYTSKKDIPQLDYIYPEEETHEDISLYFDEQVAFNTILEYSRKIEYILQKKSLSSLEKESNIRNINNKIEEQIERLLAQSV